MKILLVDNHTRHSKKLAEALADHHVEILTYKPGADFKTDDKDLVILSGGGGEGFEINDRGPKPGQWWYDNEKEFVLRCDKPILGICMGFEVICNAYGSDVEKMGWLLQGYNRVNPTTRGQSVLAKNRLKQYEAHEWSVQRISSKHFEVLGDSDTGIEIIKHKRRPLFATQFHPEFKQGTLYLKNLINNAVWA